MVSSRPQYVTIVVLVITGEVAVGVLGVMYQLRAVNSLGESLTARLKALYGTPGHETFTLAVDYVQYQVRRVSKQVAAGDGGVRWRCFLLHNLCAVTVFSFMPFYHSMLFAICNKYKLVRST